MGRLTVFLVLVLQVLLVAERAGATLEGSSYASTVTGVTGWNYECEVVGSPSGKSCAFGTTNCPGGPKACSQQPANYNPTINNTYWLGGTGFNSLTAPANMHIKAVDVDAYGSNAANTSGNINLDLGITGTGVSTTHIVCTWLGTSHSCNWFSTRRGAPRWDVTSAISSLDLNTIKNMTVEVKRHSAAGSSGSSTYYDILVSALKVTITWEFNAPDIPANFGATLFANVSPPRVDLSWSNATTDPGRICDFEISRSADGGPYQVISGGTCASPGLGAGATSLSDYGIAPGHTYAYRVRALGEGGYSGYSGPVTTTWAFSPPNAPQNLTATLQPSGAPPRVDLTWTSTPTASAPICDFEVSRTSDGGLYQVIAGGTCAAPALGGGSTGFSDLTIEKGHTYTYRVRALGPGGSSGYSSTAVVVWADPPETPQLNVAVPDTSEWPPKVSLYWSYNSTVAAPICSIEISRNVDGGAYQVVAGGGCANPVLGGNFVDLTPMPGHSVGYRIRALGLGGYSGYSGSLVVAIPNRGQPIVWTNAAGGAWENPANWNLARVPNEFDQVYINVSGTYTVTLASSTSVFGVTLGGASGAQTLSITGATLALAICNGSYFYEPYNTSSLELNHAGLSIGCRPATCFTGSCQQGNPPIYYRGNVLLSGSSGGSPVINDGNMTVRGSSYVGGYFVNMPGSTLRVEGSTCCGDASFFAGDSIVNFGTVTLTSTGGAYAAKIFSGTAKPFSNTAGAALISSMGSGGNRTVTGGAPPWSGIGNVGSIQCNAPLTLTHVRMLGGTLSCSAVLTLDNTGFALATIPATGAITFTSGGSLSVLGSGVDNSGTISGPGSISISGQPTGVGLQNSGVISPGPDSSHTGILTVAAPLTLLEGGSVQARIAGAIAGSGYDRIAMSGSAALAGSLKIALVGGYLPPPGSTFRILSATGSSGAFSNVQAAALPNGGALQPVYSDSGVILQIAGLSGETPSPTRDHFRLERPHPSPGSGRLSISFGLAKSSSARLEILDAAGKRVRLLVNSSMQSGPHRTSWDGVTDHGSVAASGVYYVRLDSEAGTLTRKFVRLR